MVETDGTSGDIRRFFDEYQKHYPADARLQYYREAAATCLLAEQDADTATTLRSVIVHADEALQALQAGDVDLFAQAFERVLRFTVQADIPAIETTARRRMGSKGGKASKRSPGPLRRVLEDIIAETGADDNLAVFSYWQQFKTSGEVSLDAAEGSSSWRHELFAAPTASIDPGKQYHQPAHFYRTLPETWDDRPPDSEHEYHYHDGEKSQVTNAASIRKTLHKIRQSR